MGKMILALLLVVLFWFEPAVYADDENTNDRDRSYEDINPDDPILQDNYVKLYVYRYQRRLLLVEKQKQEIALAQGILKRRELLLVANAVSRQEYETAVRDAEVAVLRLGEYQAQVLEAKTMLDIAVDRVSIGMEMPICVELR